eukprot:6118601-Prorocentrum_lima.AAC.1
MKKQRAQGTLRGKSQIMFSDTDFQVNQLDADNRAFLQQGPMKKSLADWWNNGTTEARLLHS